MRTLISHEVMPIPDAAACMHVWRATETPPDSVQRWQRCVSCLAFGYRKSLRILNYKCGLKGCERHAVHRLPGRDPRMAYRWRCRGHEVRER